MTAREQPGTRRRTDWCRSIELTESNAALRERIKVRRFDISRARGPQVRGPLIVRHDHDHVRPLLRDRRRSPDNAHEDRSDQDADYIAH